MLRTPAKQWTYNPRLMCAVKRLSYDFELKRGEVSMPELNCTDMVGCVTLFVGIDPLVEQILTYAEDGDWTMYQRGADDPAMWSAIDADGAYHVPVDLSGHLK